MSCCRTLSPELGVVSVPDYGHSNGCVVKSHCFAILIFIFWLHHTACGIRGPRPGIEPVSPALAAQVLNHWTTMEAPLFFLKGLFIYLFLAEPGLHCCKQTFSGRGEWRLLSNCGAWASDCSG